MACRIWFRVVGKLDPEALQAPVVVLHSGGPDLALLRRADHRAEPARARLRRSLRPGRQRAQRSTCPMPTWSLRTATSSLTQLEGASWSTSASTAATTPPATPWRGCSASCTRCAARRACCRWSPPTRPHRSATSPPAARSCGGRSRRAVWRVLDEEERRAAGRCSAGLHRRAPRSSPRGFVCRLDPWPDELVRTNDAIADDPTVYATINGPAECPGRGDAAGLGRQNPTGWARSTCPCCPRGRSRRGPPVGRRAGGRAAARRGAGSCLEDARPHAHLEAPERFLEAGRAFPERVGRGGPGGAKPSGPGPSLADPDGPSRHHLRLLRLRPRRGPLARAVPGLRGVEHARRGARARAAPRAARGRGGAARPAAPRAGAAARRPRGARAAAARPASASSTASSAAASCPARSCCSAARRASASPR